MSNATLVCDAPTLRECIETGEDLAMVDVRSPAEFETAHIPGAFNVPLDALGEHRDAIAKNVHRKVVLVCQSGGRAEQAQRRLFDAGMENVYVLKGGMSDWTGNADNPVVRGKERWALERQVRLVAGSIVLGSILVSTVAPKAKWVAAGIGGGLTFAALTNSCMMGQMLSRLPYNQVAGCDVDEVVTQLTSGGAAPSAAA